MHDTHAEATETMQSQRRPAGWFDLPQAEGEMAAGAAALGRLATAGERERRDAGGAAGAGAGGGGGRGHGDDEVDKRGDNGGVGVPAIGAEVPCQHPLEPLPVAHAVRGHHLLHGSPEVVVRVGGVERHRHAVAEGRGRRGSRRLGLGGGGSRAPQGRRTRRRIPLEDGAGGPVGLEQEAVVGAESPDDGVRNVVGRCQGLRLGGLAVGRAVGVVRRRPRGGVGEGRLPGVQEEGCDGLGGGGWGPEVLGRPWFLARGPHPCRWSGCRR